MTALATLPGDTAGGWTLLALCGLSVAVHYIRNAHDRLTAARILGGDWDDDEERAA